MKLLAPHHGSTDAGPEPRHDFSSNSNPFGPCPAVLKRVRGADFTRYPDPGYSALREALGAYHRTSADRVVVGAGASELILRLIRHHRGSVVTLGPTFSEYERCGHLERRRVYHANTPEEFLQLQRTRRALGFICWPNNPTGDLWSLDFVATAARVGRLVVDLAYAPLTSPDTLAAIEQASLAACRLYAPNKAFGLTGVRAGYVITPTPVPTLAHLAPSWVLDRGGEAFLAATVVSVARRWLDATLPRIATARRELVTGLRGLGLEVNEGPSTYVLAHVGAATPVTRALRAEGIRVRDASSFGLTAWLRLSAQPAHSQEALFSRLAPLIAANARHHEPV